MLPQQPQKARAMWTTTRTFSIPHMMLALGKIQVQGNIAALRGAATHMARWSHGHVGHIAPPAVTHGSNLHSHLHSIFTPIFRHLGQILETRQCAHISEHDSTTVKPATDFTRSETTAQGLHASSHGETANWGTTRRFTKEDFRRRIVCTTVKTKAPLSVSTIPQQ